MWLKFLHKHYHLLLCWFEKKYLLSFDIFSYLQWWNVLFQKESLTYPPGKWAREACPTLHPRGACIRPPQVTEEPHPGMKVCRTGSHGNQYPRGTFDEIKVLGIKHARVNLWCKMRQFVSLCYTRIRLSWLQILYMHQLWYLDRVFDVTQGNVCFLTPNSAIVLLCYGNL